MDVPFAWPECKRLLYIKTKRPHANISFQSQEINGTPGHANLSALLLSWDGWAPKPP